MTTINKLLTGHVSPETAYVVDDYPYGFVLRCKIRYWLEYKAKKGFRFVSQTTNPKKSNTWNTPKASTYCLFGAAMYLDENNYVQYRGLTEYADTAECIKFRDTYGPAVPEIGHSFMNKVIQLKCAYDAHKAMREEYGI